METKLMELTNKIYREGVLKAENEAKEIISKAKEDAEKILKKAEEEATSIILKARNEAEQLKNKTLSELKMAQTQAISLLKQAITNIIADIALKEDIKKTVEDSDFLKKLIIEIISKWDIENKGADLQLIIPEKQKKDLDGFIKDKIKNTLQKGIIVKFESRMKNGFKIGPKDNSFIISFTQDDLENFFYSFLKEKTKEILFPEG